MTKYSRDSYEVYVFEAVLEDGESISHENAEILVKRLEAVFGDAATDETHKVVMARVRISGDPRSYFQNFTRIVGLYIDKEKPIDEAYVAAVERRAAKISSMLAEGNDAFIDDVVISVIEDMPRLIKEIRRLKQIHE